MPVHRPRRQHIGAINGRALVLVDRRRIAVVDRLIIAHRHGNAVAPAVERGDDAARLDMIDGREHPVFHAKIAAVLQEHDAVTRRKVALAVIGLEGQRPARSFPRLVDVAGDVARPWPVLGHARQLAPVL